MWSQNLREKSQIHLTLVPLLLALFSLDFCSALGISNGRQLSHFTLGHNDNSICWDRSFKGDGFFSIIDTHNHFRPFGGPPVPFDTYINWMAENGLLFSTMFGIGQVIVKSKNNNRCSSHSSHINNNNNSSNNNSSNNNSSNKNDIINNNSPNCCYYLHCPTLDYLIVSNATNDRLNAIDYLKYRQEAEQPIHLTVSTTFANLQSPANNVKILDQLISEFPDTFKWAGEINVFKHALAGNGFFHQGERVNVAQINSGIFDEFFQKLEEQDMTVTLHCDLGCDNYDSIPSFPDGLASMGCVVPREELREAHENHDWWKQMLGPHYSAFFDEENQPRSINFKKIQHLHVWDTLLSRYPNTRVVWSHVGLSKELQNLHPLVHLHILKRQFDRHPNLYADISWDILAKTLFMNHQTNESMDALLQHPDLDHTAAAAEMIKQTKVEQKRDELALVWAKNRDLVLSTGSKDIIGGPTYAMTFYLEVFNAYSDRFVTGTDFVASMGSKEEYPGLKNPPSGCVKDMTEHAKQLTDTSSINMFFKNEAFRRIVLGENFFRLARLEDKFAPPPLCED